MRSKTLSYLLAYTFLMAGQAYASGMAPEVIVDMTGNKVVKLEVGSSVDDSSWMWIPFTEPIDTSVHTKVTVSFDIYRTQPVVGVSGHQQLNWAWVDEDENPYSGMDPYYGVSERYGAVEDLAGAHYQTYPLGWGASGIDFHAETVLNDWVTIVLEWDFGEEINGHTGWASAWYDTDSSGNPVAIVLNTPIENPEEFLAGWEICLWAAYMTGLGAGPETVLIDNLLITGSDIFNSNGFEDYQLGLLNGQYGWIAGTENGPSNEVPEPTAAFLFGAGLFGLWTTRKKMKN